MTPRKCSGCGHPLGATATYCTVCGRVQLPAPEQHINRFARMSLSTMVGLVLLVLFGLIAIVALVLLGIEWLV